MPAFKLPPGVETPSVADFAAPAMAAGPSTKALVGTGGSALDLLNNPKALATMEALFTEANPVFRRMQAAGQFGSTAARSIEPMLRDPNAAIRDLLRRLK